MKDQQILKLIKENPFITQQQLSEKLGLSRSAIAGYISSLTKRGEIVGRAYVLKEEAKVICVGGANIDRKTRTLAPVQYGTSNPASSRQSGGGVARNVAENLGRLGSDVFLIAITGEDQDGDWLMKETREHGVDVTQSVTVHGEKTGTYTSILDEAGELVLAVADMSIYNRFYPEMLEARWSHLASAEIIFADTNLPEETLHYLMERTEKEGRRLWMHTVSTPKTKRLPESLSGVEILFINREEAGELTGRSPRTMDEVRKAAVQLKEKGAMNVIVHLEHEGVFIMQESGEESHLASSETSHVDGTGVKEAFIGGMLFASTEGKSFASALRSGMAASDETWKTEETVADLSPEIVAIDEKG